MQFGAQGYIRLPSDSVISDALEASGGLSEEADRVRIAREMNLSSQIGNHTKLYMFALYDRDVPVISPVKATDTVKTSTTGGSVSSSGVVNLNSATLTELDGLPSVGPVTAQKIIDWRDDNGGFKSVDDLKQVKGIGDALFEKIKDHVTVD